MTNPQHEDPLVPEPPPVRGLAFKAALLMALTLLLVVGSVLYVMFARGVFEPTQRVVLIADDAEGVTVGMDMTFAGFAIGRVARVELGEDGNARILVDVAEKDAKWLRSSSIFTMERSLVGGTRIRAFSGVLDDPPLPDGAERTVLRGDDSASRERYNLNWRYTGDDWQSQLNLFRQALDSAQRTQEERRTPTAYTGYQRDFYYKVTATGVENHWNRQLQLASSDHHFGLGVSLTDSEIREYRDGVQTNLLTGTSIADVDPVEDGVRASSFQIDAQTYGGNNSGTADALVFAYTPVITSYTNGMILRGRITADNTGAVTVNAGGGVKSLVKHNGAALIAGDLQGPDILEFAYDSTTDVFRLNTPTYNQLARLDTNQSFTKAQGVNRSALTDAATIAVDASLSNVFTVTLAGNRTLGQPTNPKDGQSITIKITQDATGSRTLAYHADWLFAGGVDPTLSTAANAVDVLSAVYFADTAKWYASLSKGFA